MTIGEGGAVGFKTFDVEAAIEKGRRESEEYRAADDGFLAEIAAGDLLGAAYAAGVAVRQAERELERARAERDAAVRAACGAGHSVREVGTSAGISHNRVATIKSAA